MAKRDRDTGIWKDPFYRSLPPLYKCFWDFINDDCDNSGVWGCDFRVASMVIGKRIDPEKAAILFGDRILVSEDGHRWWIKTFIPQVLGFEVDSLNPSHKFQKSIMDLLTKHKIKNFRVFADTLQSVKERKGQERDKEREGQGVQGDFSKSPSDQKNDLTEDHPTEIVSIESRPIADTPSQLSDWEYWGKKIIDGEDHLWEQMKGRVISQDELDAFLSVATRCEWKMDTQHKFRITLHGFKSTIKTPIANGSKSFNRKQQQTDSLIVAHAQRWGSQPAKEPSV